MRTVRYANYSLGVRYASYGLWVLDGMWTGRGRDVTGTSRSPFAISISSKITFPRHLQTRGYDDVHILSGSTGSNAVKRCNSWDKR